MAPETKSPPQLIYRIGRKPDAWQPPDWALASTDGTFGNRFDDPEGYYRVLYAASQELSCFIETLARFRPDLTLLMELQSIDGIGPFYSALIVIRGTGFTDVLPVGAPKALALTARLYHLPGPPTEAEFGTLAEAWKPFRTWAVVLIRAAARRILADEPAA